MKLTRRQVIKGAAAAIGSAMFPASVLALEKQAEPITYQWALKVVWLNPFEARWERSCRYGWFPADHITVHMI